MPRAVGSGDRFGRGSILAGVDFPQIPSALAASPGSGFRLCLGVSGSGACAYFVRIRKTTSPLDYDA